MFRVKPTILLLFMLFSTVCVVAQPGDETKSNSMNDFFGFGNLRLNNPDLLYNQSFLKDSTYFYRKESVDTEFETFKKAIFEYDNQGRLIVENEFSRKEEVWKKSLKRLYNYDETGFVQYTVQKDWNADIADFENQSRTFYSRNIIGLVSQEVIQSYSNNGWRLNEKREFFYTDYYKVSIELNFVWLVEASTWQPKLRKLYEYNELKDILSEVLQVWVDSSSTWVNKTFRGYQYNEDGLLVNLTRSSWNNSSKEWIEETIQDLSYTPLGQIESSNSYDAIDPDGDTKESVEAIYDDDGNLNTTLYNEWNPESNEWNSYEKHEHFWSEYLLGNLDEFEEDIKCFFVNPHTVGQPWHCDGLLQNENYTLSVYDQNGGLHHTQQFKGGNYFRITENLNNGLYMIVLTGGLTTHTEKVLIRN